MAKIKSPTSFSDCFNLDVTKMNELGLFNPILNVDTPLFIDPVLLKKSKHELISRNALEQFSKRFEDIILLLSNSVKEDDLAWKSAMKLLPQKEIDGTCLGYGVNSTSGRGMPEKQQRLILRTASEIIKLGIKDPNLFMLLPLFEEGIGPDTISDLTTTAIENTLLEFSEYNARNLNIKTEYVEYKGIEREIIINPLKKNISPILLLPHDILRHLPIVNDWKEIADAAAYNTALRSRVNKMIASILKGKTKREKQEIKNMILHDKQSLTELLTVLKNGNANPYDFQMDKLGIIAWQNIISTVSHDYPLKLEKDTNSESGLNRCVVDIIEQFKFLVENKGVNKLFWREKNEPNKEKNVQMIFFAMAYSYCKANNIDINPEMDTGTGNVDFKFSHGFDKRIIVEIKNSYNSNIVSGFRTQLETYKKSEETLLGYYVIVDVGGLGVKLDNLYKIYNDEPLKKAEIYYVDAKLKLSASKRK